MATGAAPCPTSPRPTAPYVPAGHPVRRFVVGIVVVAVALGALWWSGMGSPRLRVRMTQADASSAVLVVANDSPTAVELRAADFDDPRLDGETVELPDERLQGGQELEVVVRFTSICLPTPPGGYYIPLDLTVRTAAGLERTVNAGNVADLADAVCAEPE